MPACMDEGQGAVLGLPESPLREDLAAPARWRPVKILSCHRQYDCDGPLVA